MLQLHAVHRYCCLNLYIPGVRNASEDSLDSPFKERLGLTENDLYGTYDGLSFESSHF